MSWCTTNIHPICDLLEHVKGLVLQTLSCRISMTQDNNRISKTQGNNRISKRNGDKHLYFDIKAKAHFVNAKHIEERRVSGKGLEVPSTYRLPPQCSRKDAFLDTVKEKLMRCSQCRIAKYCSAKCQKKAWPDHKRECKCLKSCKPKYPPDSVRLLGRAVVRLMDGRSSESEKLYSFYDLESN
ncbi:hypothetical protein STEG23_014035 [Scotinomys teguina]